MDETATQKACQRDAITLFHDGSCPLCQREIAMVAGHSAQQSIVLVDVSAVAADAEVAPGLTAADAMQRFHVRTADGTIVSGADAFLVMWSGVPKLAWLSALRRYRGTVVLLDGVYAAFLHVRPTMSKMLGRYDRWRRRRAPPQSSNKP